MRAAVVTILLGAMAGAAIPFLLLALIFVTFIAPEATFRFARWGCRVVLFLLGVRLVLDGEFPREGTFVVMANHSSFIDIMLFPAVMQGKYTGLVKFEVMSYPFLGVALRRFRVVSVERGRPESGFSAMEHAAEAIARGYHLCIFPEGTRTKTGRVSTFKKGGFFLAMEAGAPILPVGIEGAYRFKPKDRWTLRPGRVTVRIGEPVAPSRYEELGVEGLVSEVKERVRVLSGEVA